MIKPFDRVSSLLLCHLLKAIDIDESLTVPLYDCGLPKATLDVVDANLILSVTSVLEPLVRDEMMAMSAFTHRDVVVVRAGDHPEILNSVEVDVVLSTAWDPVPINNLELCRHPGGPLHLVPKIPGLNVSLLPGRLLVSRVSPFRSDGERRRGLEKAAAEIVRLLW